MTKDKCPQGGHTKDIRLEKQLEKDGGTLIYYRCKDCGYQWDNNEYLVRCKKDVKKTTIKHKD